MSRRSRYGYLKRAWVPLWLMKLMLKFLFCEGHYFANDGHRFIGWN